MTSAIEHFSNRLRFETDVSDVQHALSTGTPGFVLVDSRSTESWEQGRIPGAIHLPGREIAARRVFCIHCQASNENVKTNVAKCTGCGRHLLVRDHYSRRLGAYMGVMVDAEAPGEVPPIKEVFA